MIGGVVHSVPTDEQSGIDSPRKSLVSELKKSFQFSAYKMLADKTFF